MQNHVRIVGVLNIIWGIMGLIGLLVTALILVFGMFAIGAHSGEEIPFWLAGGLMSLFAIIFLVTSLPCILAGYGLIKRRHWGRILAIIVSALNLASFPFGTALGVYGLVILLNDQSRQVFESNQITPHHA
jgi:hypothetical protein